MSEKINHDTKRFSLLLSIAWDKILKKEKRNQENQASLAKPDTLDEIIETTLLENMTENEIVEHQARVQKASQTSLSKEYKIFAQQSPKTFKPLAESICDTFNYDKVYLSKADLEADYNLDPFNESKSRVDNNSASKQEQEDHGISQIKHIIPCITKEKYKEELDGSKTLIKEGGKKAIAVVVPSIHMLHFDFEDVVVISPSVINEIYGQSLSLTLNSREDATAGQTLMGLLNWSENQNVSDVHIKLYNDIQYEYTGTKNKALVKVDTGFVGIKKTEELLRQIRIDAGIDTENSDGASQDGLLVKALENGVTRSYRFNILEQVYGHSRGWSLSLRRLPREEELKSFKELGYHEQAIFWIRNALLNDNGLIVVSGETNSGKSTLLNTILVYGRDVIKKRIHRLEAPQETPLRGTVTVDMLDRAGGKNPKTYEKVMKDFMRQDPSILSLGEAKTDEELFLAFEFARTGHLTLMTNHAKDNESAIKRIRDAKNIHPDEFYDKVRMAINQELIPKACSCRRDLKEVVVDDATKQEYIFHDPNPKCPKCKGSGIETIIPLFELTVYNELSQDDNMFDIEDLKSKDKCFHISKNELYDYYITQGFIDPNDKHILASNFIKELLKKEKKEFDPFFKESN